MLGALADRFIIGDPQAASATQTEPDSLPSVLAVESESPAPGHDMPRQFPENMPELDWSRPIRNPFVPPPEVVRLRNQRISGSTVREPVTTRRRPDELLSVAAFIDAHRLTGVYVGQSAIVDGRIVQLGEKYDASQLLRVESNRAYFQCRDGEAVLSLGRGD